MKAETAQIVVAYLRNDQIELADLSAFTEYVGQKPIILGEAPPVPERSKPAVSIRTSVRNDTIACLECGKKWTILRRHLMAAHNTTTKEYRARWGLPRDYPMVARNYSTRRSQLAKSAGQRGRGRRVATE